MLTQDYLIEILDYDAINGIFRWKSTLSKKIKAGDEAGYISNDSGYRKITIVGKLYYAHRLAFLCMHGYLPSLVDHKNGVRSDNRIENLRECTQTQNNQNSKLRASSKSGFKGVVKDKRTGKWESFISLNKKKKFLGYFEDIELAAFVAQEARNLHYGDFCRHA